MIASVLSAVFLILLPSLIAFACFKRGVAVGYKAGYKAHEEDAYQHAARMREHEAREQHRKILQQHYENMRALSLDDEDENKRMSLTGW